MDQWAQCKKTIIPRKEIIREMLVKNNIKSFTTLNALNALLDKGFIRRSCTGQARNTYYVMIRTIRIPYE